MKNVTGTRLLILAVFLLNSVEPRPTDPGGNNINNVPPNIPPRARPPNGVHPLYVRDPLTNRLELRSVQVTSLGPGRFHFHFGPAPLEPRGPTGQPPRPQGGQGPPRGGQDPPRGGQDPPRGEQGPPRGGQGLPQGEQGPPQGEQGLPQGGQGRPQNP